MEGEFKKGLYNIFAPRRTCQHHNIAEAPLVHIFRGHAGRDACGFSCLGGGRHIICCSHGERQIKYFSLVAAVIL